MKIGTDKREQDLDDLFAKARAQEPLECADLMAKVFADAAQLQPQPAAFVSPRSVMRPLGFWGKLAVSLGGKGVLAGLGTVAAAGVLIGFVQPSQLTVVTDTFFAQVPLDEIELLPGIDAILIEG